MSAQESPPPNTPAPSLAPAEIKEEDATTTINPANGNANEIANAHTATVPPVATDVALPPTPSAPASPPVPAAGLTKKDYDVMVRLVKYLTEYKDEE